MAGENLNKQQRMDMVMKGLSPLNPQHVKQYMQNRGQVKASFQEAAERMSTLVGEEVYNRKNLGAGNESERQYSQAYEATGQSTPSGNSYRAPRNVKEVLQEDLGDYGTNKGGMNSISSTRLLSLREDIGNGVPQQKQANLTQYFEQGYKLSIKYLNAFIINVKDPSPTSRRNVFQCLQLVMQQEQKLQNNSRLLQKFREGCDKAERELYNKIKS